MSEEVKTIGFLFAALVTGIAAFVVSREAPQRTAEDDIGSAFVDIEDPLQVQRLKIVTFDNETGKPEPFEVGKVDGVYCIPSHEDYPADAQDHLAEAVNFVNNVEILDVVDDSPAAHQDFGVLDPLSVSVGGGESGVGMRVTMSTEDGKIMADFVIGDEVKGGEGQRYVRRAGKDQVYTVQIDPGKLSTKFEDWIERDLLKLDTSDVTQVAINDYSAVVQRQLVFGPGGPQIALATDLDMKSSIDLVYDQEDFLWKLEQLVVFADNQPNEEKLADNEELNTSKLNDLKFALDDLQIVDVRRKAKGLGENLQKAITKNPGAIDDLERRGFFFQRVKGPDDQPQFVLLSNNGEINIGLQTGVEYVLRFGNVAGADKSVDAGQEQEEDSDPAGEEEKEKAAANGEEDRQDEAADKKSDTEETKVLRYLFVMTQMNPALIDQPELEEVPPEEPPAEEPPAEEPPAEEGPATSSDDEGAADRDGATTGQEQEDPPAPGDQATEQGATEQADTEQGDTEQADTDQENASQADPGPADGDPAPKREEWQKKRAQIIQENERKQKEYEEKLENARQRVQELNARFADWYYVINDETYQKIHLSRDDIIKEKEKTEDENQKADAPAQSNEQSIEPQDDLETFDQIKQAVQQPDEG